MPRHGIRNAGGLEKRPGLDHIGSRQGGDGGGHWKPKRGYPHYHDLDLTASSCEV